VKIPLDLVDSRGDFGIIRCVLAAPYQWLKKRDLLSYSGHQMARLTVKNPLTTLLEAGNNYKLPSRAGNVLAGGVRPALTC